MIISASYKTDIPAWYGEWFMNRLRAGYCQMANPYNNALSTVPLTRETVEGFVFWTRNIRPFMEHLREVRECGFPFIVHQGLMGYPRELELTQAAPEPAAQAMHQLAQDYHPRVAIWRYDPIIFTSLTPFDWHVESFGRLAALLAGATDEVVVSFAQIYAKTRRSLDRAGSAGGWTWEDPADDVKLGLVGKLLAIAQSRGLQLSVCAESQYLIPGATEARCVDPFRLSDVAGHAIPARKKPHRKCGCYESRDIGAYNTCPAGCVYCYAVANCPATRERYRQHDPQAELLR